jgi:hypothetical protein
VGEVGQAHSPARELLSFLAAEIAAAKKPTNR